MSKEGRLRKSGDVHLRHGIVYTVYRWGVLMSSTGLMVRMAGHMYQTISILAALLRSKNEKMLTPELRNKHPHRRLMFNTSSDTVEQPHENFYGS